MFLALMLAGCEPDPAKTDDTGVVSTDDTEPNSDDTVIDDTGPDTGNPQSSWQAMVLPSSSILREEDEGGRLTVDCAFTDEGVLADPGVEATVTIDPMDGVEQDGEAWTFADYGSYTVTCSATIDGETVDSTEKLVVITEVLDPDVAAMLGAMDQSRNAHLAVAAADGGEDDAMVAAIEALTAAAVASESALDPKTTSVFRPMPDDYWPTPTELEAEGIARNADDDALGQALTDFGDALRLLDENLAAMDPLALTEDDLTTLTDLDAQVQAAGDALVALSPTAHGWLEQREAVFSQLMKPANAVTTTTARFSETRLRNDAVDILPPFGLIGLALGAVNVGGLRGYYIKKVIVPVVEQLDLSINNMILMGLIEYFAPGDGGVTIDHIQASSSVSFALPGYDTWIYGSGFSTTASMNKFLIVGVDWQEALGTIMDGCGIEDGDTVPEIVDDIDSCIDTVNDAIDNSQANSQQVVNDGVWGEQGVGIGPFPDVCGDGWVPITIGIMGINSESGGRTAGFYQLSCIP